MDSGYISHQMFKNIWKYPPTSRSITVRPSSLFGEEAEQHVVIHAFISVLDLTGFSSAYSPHSFQKWKWDGARHGHPVSVFHEYCSLKPDVTCEQMEIFLKYHSRTAVQRGRVNGNVGRMSCEIFEDQTIVALASSEGGNKDTLVPERIKSGGKNTKRPNRMLMLSSSA